MKGKTEIILTNVETGKVRVYEDENLITDALDKLININVAMNYALNSYVLPFATNALGGIMLFDGQLEEDKGNIHFPADAHLVGYAGQNVNTTDKYRGSYNAIESGKTMTGFVSAISRALGGKSVDLLGNPSTVLLTCIVIIAWQFIPFYKEK